MRPLRRDEKQWLFPISTLRRTPSQDVGMPYEEELQDRANTVSFIRSLAARLVLNHSEDPRTQNGGRAKGVLTVAATLTHRFYMRRSIQDFPPHIMAATILFISSKIEEEPLKLRHIVNQCLQKFDHAIDDKLWWPAGENGPQPSADYRRWEEEILACEELAHEALCFDMIVDQPWPVLLNGVTGLDEFWADGAGPSGFGELADVVLAEAPAPEPMEEGEEGEVMEPTQQSSASVLQPRKGAMVTENVVLVLGWQLLSELYLYPLPVLYHPNIIAFAAFRIALSSLLPQDDTIPALVTELAPRFGLDAGPAGILGGQEKSDMELVEDCLRDISELAEVDLKIKNESLLKKLWAGYVKPRLLPLDA